MDYIPKKDSLFYSSALSLLLHGLLIFIALASTRSENRIKEQKKGGQKCAVITVTLQPTASARKKNGQKTASSTTSLQVDLQQQQPLSQEKKQAPLQTSQKEERALPPSSETRIEKNRVQKKASLGKQSATQKSTTPIKKGSKEGSAVQKKSSTIENRAKLSHIDEALGYLNETNQYSEKRQASSSGSTHKKRVEENASSIRIAPIGTLQSEIMEGANDHSFSSEAQKVVSNEEWYIEDLIRRIKLAIRLKGAGTVKLLLTIERNGKCTSVSIVESSSNIAKERVQLALLDAYYSPFGPSFRGEKSHTFRITLEDDGNY